ncbi:hypothetical protein TIFTF001_026863 [Ficus carica]|uniref:Pentatricopeptide repeat-containing protein n=1 Tax=Ficus carica TaxID=3494 RepID=A0AA88IU61_FICCA|nr:hypothetical protein TIFTF001_026863 [Ficus carica]
MARPRARRRLPKNLRYPRRAKLPPDFGTNLFLKSTKTVKETYQHDVMKEEDEDEDEEEEEEGEEHGECDDDIVWESDEIEAITSLFRARIPQKPGQLNRARALPLPLPHQIRPLRLPTPKKRSKMASPVSFSSRKSLSKQVYKSPGVLIGLAREIKGLTAEEDVSLVLDKWAQFLRKGSLSMTIRELGHLGLPERALQTFCWAQKQPHLFPDDRVLASTVEVLARNHTLKVPFDLEKFVGLASQGVIEAMVRGFTKGGSLHRALKLLSIAKTGNRILDPSVYAKVVLELAKNPDKHTLAAALLDELGDRDDLNLTQQDCTAIMKVCVKLGKFETVEGLHNWFRQSGHEPSVVMYTTLVHSRCSEKKYREALAVVWDMESSNCLFDLPAYRVVIRLSVALNGLPRASRYFSRLKESGFSPTYDIYRDMINLYMVSGRLGKCRDVCKEAEMAGFKLDKQLMSQLLQLGEKYNK